MRRLLTTGACALALAPASGCGGDDEEFEPIPARQADAIVKQLDQVAERCDADQVGSARFQVRELEQKIADLPDGIDPDLRAALDDGLARLRDLVETDCERDEEEPTDTVETETVPTDTVETETETTETEPPPQTETQPPVETTPPDIETGPSVPPGQDNGGTPPGQGGGAAPEDGF